MIDRQKSFGFTAVLAVPVLKRRLSRYGRRPVQGDMAVWAVTVRGKNIPSDGLVRTVVATARVLRVGASGPTGDGDSDLWRDRAACRAVPTEWFFPVGRHRRLSPTDRGSQGHMPVLPGAGVLLGVCVGDRPGGRHLGGRHRRRAPRPAQDLFGGWPSPPFHQAAPRACSGARVGSSGRLNATGGNVRQNDGARDAALLGI